MTPEEIARAIFDEWDNGSATHVHGLRPPGRECPLGRPDEFYASPDCMMAMIAAAIRAEREACAKIAERPGWPSRSEIADAIRAR